MNINTFKQLASKAQFGTLTANEQKALADYSNDLLDWNDRFVRLLTLMQGKSSWSSKIEELLQMHSYGTLDPKVIEAAKRYISTLSAQKLNELLNK